MTNQPEISKKKFCKTKIIMSFARNTHLGEFSELNIHEWFFHVNESLLIGLPLTKNPR